MREFMQPIFDIALALRTQLHVALLIPLAEAAQRNEAEVASSDSSAPCGSSCSSDVSFKCVDDRPGHLTTSGLGSLEIGAAYDD